MFGRATIRLGIGPHSSYYLIFRTIWILFAHKHGRIHLKNYASFVPVHM